MGQFEEIEEIEEMDNNPLELTHASVIANFSGRSISRTTYVVKERFLTLCIRDPKWIPTYLGKWLHNFLPLIYRKPIVKPVMRWIFLVYERAFS